jgi:hypothetical protein
VAVELDAGQLHGRGLETRDAARRVAAEVAGLIYARPPRRGLRPKTGSIRLHEIVLSDTLDQQEPAGLPARIQYPVNRSSGYRCRPSDGNFVARGRIAGFHDHRPLESIVVIGNLRVPVPRNGLARIKRVLPYEDIGAFRDDVDGPHFVGLGFCLAHDMPAALFRLDAGVTNDLLELANLRPYVGVEAFRRGGRRIGS